MMRGIDGYSFRWIALSVIALQCHLPQRGRQRISQVQHLLTMGRNWLSPWESCHRR